MTKSPSRAVRIFSWAVLIALALLLVWGLTRPSKRPETQRMRQATGDIEQRIQDGKPNRDASLVKQLLAEDLQNRRFSFAAVVLATSDKKVLPLQKDHPAHQRVLAAIDRVLAETADELSQPDSPARGQRRINEVSRYFEDAILEKLNRIEGVSCTIPQTREGHAQRSGYPDLRITDLASGLIFYLDPKLVERNSWKSSLRSFYFAPKDETLKVTDDAVHLLVGIAHDGRDGEWTFGPWKIVDLSTLKVRLKAEFQASNADLYATE